MRKFMAFCLAGVLAFSMTACGNGDDKNVNHEDSKGETKVEETETALRVTDATDLLNQVWAAYGEEEKFYGVGGDMNNAVENAPGKFDHTKATENGMENNLCFPEAAVSYIDDAASLVHGMIANNFTGAAYHVTDKGNVKTVVDSIQERTMNNRWMCGFPETLVIYTVGEDYVVSAYGAGDIITTFKNKMTEVYGDAAVVCVEGLL